MATVVLTYGDPSPTVRDAIGEALTQSIHQLAPSATIVGTLTGEGSFEGRPEHSGALVIIDVPALASPRLREEVSYVALHFRQEAIGFIVDHAYSTLVPAGAGPSLLDADPRWKG